MLFWSHSEHLEVSYMSLCGQVICPQRIYRKHSITSLHTMQLWTSCACSHRLRGPSAWSHLSKLLSTPWSFVEGSNAGFPLGMAAKKRTILALTSTVITLVTSALYWGCMYTLSPLFYLYALFYHPSKFIYQGASFIFWYPLFLLIPDFFYPLRSCRLNASAFPVPLSHGHFQSGLRRNAIDF